MTITDFSDLGKTGRRSPFGLWDDIIYHTKIAISALIGYVARGRVHAYFENWAMYQPTNRPVLTKLRNEALRRRVERDIFFETEDGVVLQGWYSPGNSELPTAVFAHGNYGNMADREEILKAFAKFDIGLFIFSYRGFGCSGGRPDEEGLYKDFTAASRYVAEQLGIPLNGQIAMGESMGGAVAIQAASRNVYYALVVLCTFTSIPDVYLFLRQKMPVLRWLLPNEKIIRQRFNSMDKISSVTCPMFMVQGDSDMIVPLLMSTQLFEKATRILLKRKLIIPGGTHDNLFYIAPETIMENLIAFLQEVKKSRPLEATIL